jgi:hypothetical protein
MTTRIAKLSYDGIYVSGRPLFQNHLVALPEFFVKTRAGGTIQA